MPDEKEKVKTNLHKEPLIRLLEPVCQGAAGEYSCGEYVQLRELKEVPRQSCKKRCDECHEDPLLLRDIVDIDAYMQVA